MTKNELFEYVLETYHTKPDFPWEKFPEYAVFRHGSNRKWFALFMPVDGEKVSKKLSGEVDTLSIKTEPSLRVALTDKQGIYEAYHLNKNHWITIVLSDVLDEDLKALLDISFELTK